MKNYLLKIPSKIFTLLVLTILFAFGLLMFLYMTTFLFDLIKVLIDCAPNNNTWKSIASLDYFKSIIFLFILVIVFMLFYSFLFFVVLLLSSVFKTVDRYSQTILDIIGKICISSIIPIFCLAVLNEGQFQLLTAVFAFFAIFISSPWKKIVNTYKDNNPHDNETN